jgi:hypothetical protein
MPALAGNCVNSCTSCLLNADCVPFLFVQTAMSTIDNGYDIELGVPEAQKRLPPVPEEPSSDVHGMYFFAVQSCRELRPKTPLQLCRCLYETSKLN